MPVEDAESETASDAQPGPGSAMGRFSIEVVVGIVIGLALLLAIIASTGEIPFVYQGY